MTINPKISIDARSPNISVTHQAFQYTQFWDTGLIWDSGITWDTGIVHSAPSISVGASRPIISTV